MRHPRKLTNATYWRDVLRSPSSSGARKEAAQKALDAILTERGTIALLTMREVADVILDRRKGGDRWKVAGRYLARGMRAIGLARKAGACDASLECAGRSIIVDSATPRRNRLSIKDADEQQKAKALAEFAYKKRLAHEAAWASDHSRRLADRLRSLPPGTAPISDPVYRAILEEQFPHGEKKVG